MLRRAAGTSKAHTGGEGSEAMECLRPLRPLRRAVGRAQSQRPWAAWQHNCSQQRGSPVGCQKLFSDRRLTQAGSAHAGGGSCKAVECGGPSGGLQGGLVGRHNVQAMCSMAAVLFPSSGGALQQCKGHFCVLTG